MKAGMLCKFCKEFNRCPFVEPPINCRHGSWVVKRILCPICRGHAHIIASYRRIWIECEKECGITNVFKSNMVNSMLPK